MHNRLQDISALLIAAIITLSVGRGLSADRPSPQGVFLPSTEQHFQSCGADVLIYAEGSARQLLYQPVGVIKIQLHSQQPTSAGQEAVLAYAKALASKAGAEAIQVTQFFHTVPNTVPGRQAGYFFSGFAMVKHQTFDKARASQAVK